MLVTRRALALCLAFTATVCAAATSLRGQESNRKPLAFASSFSPSLFRSSAATSAQSPFLGEISRASVSVEEVAQGVQSISMGSRRNLKKEKRLRNEHCARQFRKPKARFSRGGGRAARAEQDNKDSEWLEQIYGQHTIYRRDEQVIGGAAPAAGDDKPAPAANKVEAPAVTA